MSTASPQRAIYRFGAFELDARTRELRKNGLRIRCQEQPLQVLATLLARPGELLTREELRQMVWPEDTFVDFDHALTTAVKKIRLALNDDADSPRYLETVPRHGYRFIAPVQTEMTTPQPNEKRVTRDLDLPSWRAAADQPPGDCDGGVPDCGPGRTLLLEQSPGEGKRPASGGTHDGRSASL